MIIFDLLDTDYNDVLLVISIKNDPECYHADDDNKAKIDGCSGCS
mgnify:CR=1 FL=1